MIVCVFLVDGVDFGNLWFVVCDGCWGVVFCWWDFFCVVFGDYVGVCCGYFGWMDFVDGVYGCWDWCCVYGVWDYCGVFWCDCEFCVGLIDLFYCL